MNNLNDENSPLIDQALGILAEKTGIVGVYHPLVKRSPGNILQSGEIEFHLKTKGKPYVFEIELFPKPLHNGAFSIVDNFLTQQATGNSKKDHLLVAPSISEKIKRRCREQGVGYLDSGGNLYFSMNDTIVFIHGQKVPKIPEDKAPNRAFSKTGLKVIFNFLIAPENVNLSYRQIAAGTGVSLGTMKEVMQGLFEAGFLLEISANHRGLIKRKQLLDQWISGYFLTLKSSLFKGYYDFLPGRDEHALLNNNAGLIWTGERGAAFLDTDIVPSNFEGYTDLSTAGLVSAGLQPSKGENGKVRLYNKFWSESQLDIALVTPMLTYADLVITEDPRNEEAARIIYKRFLGKVFDHD